jgi:hypothetical protein
MRKILKQSTLSLFFLITILLCDIVFADYLGRKQYGMLDFKEYWSAFQILQTGNNPYDPHVMLMYQKTAFDTEIPLMMWNPPWILVLLAPVLALDFQSAARAWFVIQVLFFAVSLILVLSVNKENLPSRHAGGDRFLLYVCIPGLIFSPVFNSLFYGQIGCLLLLGVSLVYYGVFRSSPVSFGAGVLLLSVKPHLFILLGVALLWWILRKGKYSFVYVSALFVVTFMFITFALSPRLLGWWVDSILIQDHEIVPGIFQWIGSNFGGALRHYVHPDFVYVNFLMPLFASIIFLILALKGYLKNIDWRTAFPCLLILSVYLAPFGWFFDQSVLLIVHVSVILNAYRLNSRMILVACLLLQILSHLYLQLYMEYLVEMFWYAPLLFILWLVSEQRKQVCVYIEEK